MDEQQSQYDQPQPHNPPAGQSPPSYGQSGPYGGYNNDDDPFSQPPPVPVTHQPFEQPAPTPPAKKRPNIPIVVFGLIGAIFVFGLFLTFKPAKKAPSKNTVQAAQQTIKLATYKDSASGFQFSYKPNWHIKTIQNSQQSGQIIYLAPSLISTDSDAQKHLDSPELVFYIYNSNPSPGHDTVPIAPPAKKLGELELATNNIVATVVSNQSGQGKIVTLSDCKNALCIFKAGSKYIRPTIQTIGTASGKSGHNVDETSADFQSEVKVWQFINY